MAVDAVSIAGDALDVWPARLASDLSEDLATGATDAYAKAMPRVRCRRVWELAEPARGTRDRALATTRVELITPSRPGRLLVREAHCNGYGGEIGFDA
jgi:hypothetical protein